MLSIARFTRSELQHGRIEHIAFRCFCRSLWSVYLIVLILLNPIDQPAQFLPLNRWHCIDVLHHVRAFWQLQEPGLFQAVALRAQEMRSMFFLLVLSASSALIITFGAWFVVALAPVLALVFRFRRTRKCGVCTCHRF